MKRWHWLMMTVCIALWGYIVTSCRSGSGGGDPDPEPEPVVKTTPYPWKKPANFPDPVYDFKNNPLTREGVALGRALFYDGMLSRNGTISCGFCHQPFTAFAHTDHALSHGIDDRIGTRNVPGIQNAAWSKHFFWDGGIVDLDLLALSPIRNPVEMGDSLPNVMAKLRGSGKYRTLFEEAYGTDSITSERFLKALSQFMLTLVSANSRYDKFSRNEGVTLTEEESRGLNLFKAKCSTCHAGELFTDASFRNNGLPRITSSTFIDWGRYSITLQEADRQRFAVPSLRNVQVTPPYMHDGRFRTLEQVLNHYASGVVDGPTLDPLLRQNGRLGIPLTSQEQADIVAFLRTLTDYDFINNREFQPQ
ncbi:cytochrome-c peroxidase [Tellurirhabdus rosea]|uniref:cytochrome-c peroxidase n=1 Tax=Tellurirhabdus rosea TaxID=2674997 RepID=UPI00225C06EA|nr:cytochrome c peroxidase [Tellurirhabdus rosea]